MSAAHTQVPLLSRMLDRLVGDRQRVLGAAVGEQQPGQRRGGLHARFDGGALAHLGQHQVQGPLGLAPVPGRGVHQPGHQDRLQPGQRLDVGVGGQGAGPLGQPVPGAGQPVQVHLVHQDQVAVQPVLVGLGELKPLGQPPPRLAVAAPPHHGHVGDVQVGLDHVLPFPRGRRIVGDLRGHRPAGLVAEHEQGAGPLHGEVQPVGRGHRRGHLGRALQPLPVPGGRPGGPRWPAEQDHRPGGLHRVVRQVRDRPLHLGPARLAFLHHQQHPAEQHPGLGLGGGWSSACPSTTDRSALTMSWNRDWPVNEANGIFFTSRTTASAGRSAAGQQVEQQRARGGLVAGGQGQVGGLLGVAAPLGRLAGFPVVPGQLGDRLRRAALQRVAGPAVQRPGAPARRSPRTPPGRPARAGTTPCPGRPRPAARSAAPRPGRGRAGRPPARRPRAASASSAGPASTAAAARTAWASAPSRRLRSSTPSRMVAGTMISSRLRRTQLPLRRARSARSCMSSTVSSTASGTPSVRSCRNSANAADTRSPSSIEETSWTVSATLMAAARAAARPRRPASGMTAAAAANRRARPRAGRSAPGWAAAAAATPRNSRNSSVASSAQCTSSTTSTVTPQAGEQLVQRAEQPVPGRGRVLGRLRRGRQIGRPFRKQWPQRSRQAAQPELAAGWRWPAGWRRPSGSACTAAEMAGTPPPCCAAAGRRPGPETPAPACSCRSLPRPRPAPALAAPPAPGRGRPVPAAVPAKAGADITGTRPVPPFSPFAHPVAPALPFLPRDPPATAAPLPDRRESWLGNAQANSFLNPDKSPTNHLSATIEPSLTHSPQMALYGPPRVRRRRSRGRQDRPPGRGSRCECPRHGR